MFISGYFSLRYCWLVNAYVKKATELIAGEINDWTYRYRKTYLPIKNDQTYIPIIIEDARFDQPKKSRILNDHGYRHKINLNQSIN